MAALPTADRPRGARRTVAVVGSGVAGLTAAYVLSRGRVPVDVVLYEADDRLGGHAHTNELTSTSGGIVAVDSGFIVHNRRTYPTLLRLFSELGVATQESDMSMSVRCDGCGLEYAGGKGPRGLLAQPSRLAHLGYPRMLAEVLRFHRHARRILAEPADVGDPTLGEVVSTGGYSPYFVAHFLTPLVAAVWSCAPALAAAYPARYLFTFLAHHGMLSVTGSPPWRTVVGGSRSYVERVAKQLHAVRTATPVREVRREETGVAIRDDSDSWQHYDAAVVATHADQALRLLSRPSDDERTVLGAFRYSRNQTLLHADTSVLPHRRAASASWNYRMDGCTSSADRVLVSYDMNRLQRLPGPDRYLVTLNGDGRIAADTVLARMVYEHPVYTPESVAAQRRLPALNDARLSFAGAYHGWGFHEDGARAGLSAARDVGGDW